MDVIVCEMCYAFIAELKCRLMHIYFVKCIIFIFSLFQSSQDTDSGSESTTAAKEEKQIPRKEVCIYLFPTSAKLQSFYYSQVDLYLMCHIAFDALGVVVTVYHVLRSKLVCICS